VEGHTVNGFSENVCWLSRTVAPQDHVTLNLHSESWGLAVGFPLPKETFRAWHGSGR